MSEKHNRDDSLQSEHLIKKASTFSMLEAGVAFDPFEDQVIVFQHQKNLGYKNGSVENSAYEKWVQEEVDRLHTMGEESGFISLVSLCCGQGEYLLAFRFTDYRSTMHWIRSAERLAWGESGKGLCQELGHDLAQGGATMVPDSLKSVVKRNFRERSDQSGNSLTNESGIFEKAHRTGCICGASPLGDKPCGRSSVGPPPAWRNVVVIVCAASTIFVPAVYTVVPHFYAPFLPEAYGGMIPGKPGTPCTIEVLKAPSNVTFDNPCGAPPQNTNVMFWGFLLTVFVVNAIVIWVSVPIWNWILRPFTHGIRRFSECGLNFEPFTCLDDGFPCFRPHPPGWEAAMSANEQAIEDASKRLVKAVRTQNAVRHRLMARIDALEDEIFKKGSDGTSTGASKTTVDKISEAARKRVDSAATTAVNLRIKKEVKGMQKAIEDNVSGGEASMYICTCVEPSKQMQAEELLHDIAKAAYDHAEGLLGFLTLLRDEKKSGLLVYDIYLEFETAAQLKDWVESDIRRNYLQLGASIFSIPEGGPAEETMNIHDSISSLFVQPANKYSSRQSKSDEAGQGTKFEWHPKTWKMYLAMNVAFTIVGYPLGDLWLLAPDGPLNQLFDANGNPWPTWVKVILNVSVLVIVVVYVAVPIVIYYAAHWLFEPWTKSSNPIVSVLEEGLPCCLADGPGPDAVSNEPAGVGVELQEV